MKTTKLIGALLLLSFATLLGTSSAQVNADPQQIVAAAVVQPVSLTDYLDHKALYAKGQSDGYADAAKIVRAYDPATALAILDRNVQTSGMYAGIFFDTPFYFRGREAAFADAADAARHPNTIFEPLAPPRP